MKVSISNGNRKMEDIKSVSLPPVVTCIKCACTKKCYAKRMANFRKTVRDAWKRNLAILQQSPDVYWREVEAAVMTSRVFRFHVSGDIVDSEYFKNMVLVAKRNRHCDILCFTKKFAIVNEYIDTVGNIPKNLHLIFSGWIGLKIDNPHEIPECHVMMKNGETTAKDGAKYCSGNCTECFMENKNCFNLKKGEQILIKEH